MLALKSKTALAVLIGTISLGLNSIGAQQTPSQRYQPLSQPANQSASRAQQYAQSYPSSSLQNDSRQLNMTPPSVHVPPQNARQLSAPPFGGRTNSQDQAASYSFSDSPALRSTPQSFSLNERPMDQDATSLPYEREGVMQTSYSEEIRQGGEPTVPDILAGTNRQPGDPVFQTPRQSSTGTTAAAAPMISETDPPTANAVNSPAHFSKQIEQMRGNSPRIAPQEFSSSNQIRQEFDNLQKQVAARQEAKNGQRVATGINAAPTAQIPTKQTAPKAIGNSFTESISNPKAARAVGSQQPNVAEVGANESASEFISKLDPNRNNNSFTSDDQVRPAGGTVTAQNGSPATMHMPVDVETQRDSNVRPASAQTDSITNASIRLTAPSIAVETYGPQTVGINKPAIYKVVVTNTSNTTADRILVGIDFPAWIDIENVNLTGGEKEVTDGKQQARLVWKVDQIPGNGTQTITVTAVPRKAETFDLGIEWTLAPRAGTANIQVTQPKLEMSIVGPDEVQFGEQALYHVTVRNPGTGAAENVIVMLPEALGGERASLGNIAAGKDKKFQVELLARTAGQLELMATAIGDGNLEVAANRKLIVRRANLGISISGPSLKYAGSIGQFLVKITNNGDATAHEVLGAMALPKGVQFLGGIESFKLIEGGLKWQVGSLEPGQAREYKISCQLDTSGDLQLEVGTQGKGDLQAASACVTKVETVADLVLTVEDPKGPLPTGQSTMYEISIRNRGSRAAKGVNVVMQFSEGIEPKTALGLEHRLVPGQVLFSPISQIDPGQVIKFKVDAEAFKPGTHVFRAQLICEESDSREIAEGTTKFFGDEIRTPQQNTANQKSQAGGSQDFNGGVKR